MKVNNNHRKFWEVIRDRSKRWSDDADQKKADWACSNVDGIFAAIRPQDEAHAAHIANQCVNYISSPHFCKNEPTIDGFLNYYKMGESE